MSKQSTQMGYGKLNEEQLRILEDVPGSAVELQVKDKVNCFALKPKNEEILNYQWLIVVCSFRSFTFSI